jgi:hypothetical protein
MKVWEFEEGKIYKVSDEEDSFYKIENGICKVKFEEWEKSTAPINSLTILDFEEVVDTNSHWKRSDDSMTCRIFPGEWNIFHYDDKDKVKCLELETEIKSTLLNWRRLHDNVELDWKVGTHWKDKKWHIFYGIDKICFNFNEHFIESGFGHFSSKEKAKQFYGYMKHDIDKYFEMRKRLKF